MASSATEPTSAQDEPFPGPHTSDTTGDQQGDDGYQDQDDTQYPTPPSSEISYTGDEVRSGNTRYRRRTETFDEKFSTMQSLLHVMIHTQNQAAKNHALQLQLQKERETKVQTKDLMNIRLPKFGGGRSEFSQGISDISWNSWAHEITLQSYRSDFGILAVWYSDRKVA